MKNVLRSLKPLAFPFIHSAFPRIQRARPRSSFVRANPDPTACPQAGASAEPPAEAKPALSATCLPSAGSQAGRGLLTRSGNAAFRRQPPQTTHARRGLLTAPIPDATAARSDVAQMAKSGCVDACLPATALRACLETTRGAVFGEKAGWRGATKENIPGESSTEEQRSQTAFSAKTLRAAGLLSVAGVGSVVTARCGDASTSPPWPQPKSLAAAPLVVSKQAPREMAKIPRPCRPGPLTGRFLKHALRLGELLASVLSLNRLYGIPAVPSGLGALARLNPALKGWAIINCPSGTWSARYVAEYVRRHTSEEAARVNLLPLPARNERGEGWG